MSRPTNFDDLDETRKLGRLILTVDHTLAASLPPDVGAAILTLMHLLGGVDGVTADHDPRDQAEITYRLNLSTDERDRALRSAQQQWDYASEAYQKALEDPGSVESWLRYIIDGHVMKEGLAPIDWNGDQ